ncbi:MAG: hypothetical protein GVY20_13395 [Bacteroidetes bacterium]|jgi:hypothetical protein|nr:hypothetical protein [Bacteroidota bacterium]
MKKYYLIAALLFLLISGFKTVHAQDGFFSNAQTFREGTFAVGIQPTALTEQNDFMMIFRAGYGLTPRLTGHLKLGAFDDELYAGAHVEYGLTSEPNSALSVALLGGAYQYDEPGLKFGLNISRDFEPISLYTGLNYQPMFITEDFTLNSFLLPVGLDYHVENAPVDLMLEADIPLNDDAEYLEAITFGARIYVN